jgi:hypothetical protein
MDNNTNGTNHSSVCPSRANEQPHCYHVAGPPVTNPGVSVITMNLCCWCAPSYYRVDVRVSDRVPTEEVVAANMEHGPLVLIQSMPKRNAGLHLAR